MPTRRRQSAPSLLDIAERTGLARSTVAGILRGAPGFNPRTRRRVLAVAQALGYRPDPLGRALAGGRSMTIGVLVGSFDAAVLWKVQAIESAARRAGYLTYVMFAAERSAGLTAGMAQSLLERRIDGLIAFGLAPPSEDLAALLVGSRRPVVYIDAAPDRARARVTIDNAQGMREVAAHLAGLGHHSAAFVGLDFDHRWPAHKIVPYRAAFEATGLRLVATNRWTAKPDPAGSYPAAAYELVRRRLRAGRAPTAIVTCDDEMALAIAAAIRDAGLRVPDDISLVGYDDHPIAQHAQPPLTTLRQPRGEVGEAAFAMLARQMQEPGAPVEPVVFESRLVVRASTGRARQRSLGRPHQEVPQP